MRLQNILIVLLWCFSQSDASHADDDTAATQWTEFRGPTAMGTAFSDALPLRWSNQKNVTWKVAIPGHGLSSPVISGQTVWLTTADPDQSSLHVLRLDLQSGELLSDTKVFDHDNLWAIHWKNSHASPTPLLHDDMCFVHFGSHGTAALNSSGTILWTQRLPYYHHHGPSNSPVLVDDMLILVCDGLDHSFYDDRVIPDAIAPQFLAALDAKTGEIRWIKPRNGRHSYATPLVINLNGAKQLISPGGDRVVAYDPETGEEIWWVRYDGYSLVPRPVFGNGLVFVCTGYDEPTLLAIRPDGTGDVTASHVAWKSDRSVPLNPSPILADDQLYTLSDAGILTHYAAESGNVVWRKRVGGDYSASPILHRDRLYLLSESGTMTIVSTGDRYKVFARNSVPGTTLASPAVNGNSLFIRTNTHLFRIDEQSGATTDSAARSDSPPPAAKTKQPNQPPIEIKADESPGIRIIGKGT